MTTFTERSLLQLFNGPTTRRLILNLLQELSKTTKKQFFCIVIDVPWVFPAFN